MDGQYHIIRRQILDVAVTGTESDGFTLQRGLGHVCQDLLAPALDGILDQLVPDDEHWIIDRLDVEAGSIALETFERDLVEAVTKAIERQLRELVAWVSSDPTRGTARRVASSPPRGYSRQPMRRGATDSSDTIERRTDAQSVHEAFLYFLETGSLPWWFRLPAGKALEDVILQSWQTAGQPARFEPTLMGAIAADSGRTRLVRQFSDGFLRVLLTGLAADGVFAVRAILAETERPEIAPEMFRRLAEQLWWAAFTVVASGRPLTVQSAIAEWANAPGPGGLHSGSPLIERIARSFSATQSRTGGPEEGMARDGVMPPDTRAEAGIPRDTPDVEGIKPRRAVTAVKPERRDSGIDLEESVFVECAGLLLLHPFLPTLFEALEFVKDNRLVRADRALCLLHFLATGERRAPEYELLLPKILCDLPLADPVEAPVTLTAAEEAEAITLLEAVVRHWDALGEASVDALRGTFLTRPGKFFLRANGDDVLQVESRSFDILLDRLPWGFGMIKLPWMEKILWVEWRF